MVMKMIMYKSQSAMEYLTTYGWALLIIALALASLFYLGLFNQGGIVNNECIFPSNFICLNGFVSANGNLALSIKQETQNPIVITAIGCNTNSSNIVMASIFPTIDLPIGAQTNLTATCYSGTSAFSGKIGDIFSGYVMINYTDTLSGYSKIVKGTVISKISTSSSPLTFTPVAFVPLTITNLQSIPTSSPFQTAIEFNPSTYSSYEASDLGNIRFFSGSTELYSWCETGCTSASSSSIFWVKLPQGVAASSTLSVNMSFGANTLNYDGNYAGEAPQQSPVYGEYNNVNKIMNNGLLYQVYYTSGITTGCFIPEADLYQATMYNGAVIPICANPTATNSNPTQSGLYGTTQNVNGGNQNYVEFNYQCGYTGGAGYPNPPVSNGCSGISAIKALGWVEESSATTFSVLIDDGGAFGYNTAPTTTNFESWLGGSSNPSQVINEWFPEGATWYGGTLYNIGTTRIEWDYTNWGGPGYDGMLSNSQVNYYSSEYPPNGVMPSVTFGTVQSV